MIRKLFFCGLIMPLTFICGIAAAQTVTLDYYFNHESHKVEDGSLQRFHYLWEDNTNTGFSIWGNIFKQEGATLNSLDVAPTVANLKASDVYIIVDPDTKKENPQPNYISDKDAVEIAAWVKAGGVLVLMANDSANVELPHFNILANRFGMHFNNDLQNHVIDDAHFADGGVAMAGNSIFKTTKTAFLKDVCSIELKGNAKPAFKSANGAVIAAIAKLGKGTVFAVGDPWLYNEYVNGRLPNYFDNDNAARDLAKWLLTQIQARKLPNK